MLLISLQIFLQLGQRFISAIHTTLPGQQLITYTKRNRYLNLDNLNQTLRIIKFSQQTEFRLVKSIIKNWDYNPNLAQLNRVQKSIFCVYVIRIRNLCQFHSSDILAIFTLTGNPLGMKHFRRNKIMKKRTTSQANIDS